jgi:hypothetical protein
MLPRTRVSFVRRKNGHPSSRPLSRSSPHRRADQGSRSDRVSGLALMRPSTAICSQAVRDRRVHPFRRRERSAADEGWNQRKLSRENFVRLSCRALNGPRGEARLKPPGPARAKGRGRIERQRTFHVVLSRPRDRRRTAEALRAFGMLRRSRESPAAAAARPMPGKKSSANIAAGICPAS